MTKTKETNMWVFTLTTQYAIKIQIIKLLGGISKDVTDIVRCKGGYYMFTKEKRCRIGCEQYLEVTLITF